jgi:transposase InsO family protein
MIAAIEQAFPDLALRQICRWLGVSRSWDYARPSVEERAARDVALRDASEHLTLAFPGYGDRRVTRALQRDGWNVTHKRVLRIMRQESLLCHLKRRFVRTTDSTQGYAAYPHLLATTAVSAPDQVWVADITHVRLPTAFVYLACLLDAYSRRCLGWKLSRQIDTRLTLDALARALAQRQPAPTSANQRRG